MVTSMVIRRELYFFEEDLSLLGIRLWWDGNDIHHLRATITGPASSPYEGGIFRILIYLPDLYPFAPPVMRFITKVWHPNIGRQNGVVSLSCLNSEWTSAMNLATALISLQASLSTPDLSDPQDDGVLIQYLNDKSRFINKARRWTETHATSHDDNPAPQPQERRRFARLPTHLNDFLS